MNESEKRLRERIAGTLTPKRLTEALDALLAEHRAEAEALQEELKRANQSRASARDAALEEVAKSFNGLCVDCQRGPVNPEHERCWHEHDSATRIRALKSQPASAAPVEYVQALEAVRTAVEPTRRLTELLLASEHRQHATGTERALVDACARADALAGRTS